VEMISGLVGMFAAVGIFVGVPLAILRSLQEIKAEQRRLEARLVALEVHLRTPDGVG
jgi:hypothetical protein